MIIIENLVKKFNGIDVLKNISFSVEEGKIQTIIGDSGAGKTTLLRCIAGLENADKGFIKINDKFLCKEENNKSIYIDEKYIKESIGFIFQDYNLFPHLTVLENLILAPMYTQKVKRSKAVEMANDVLRKLSLCNKIDSYPCELSGGEKQRVAIGRALMLNPKVICFDEPTSALDPELTEQVCNIIKELSNENITILIITHDMYFAKKISHRIMFMEKGRIIENEDKDEIFSSVKNERVKKFIKSVI